jgi:quercetin dioxygenase-like cupin family protein
MIAPGDRLENPVTGEVLVFHRTAAQSGGESALVETILRPGAAVAAAHVHPHQTERFEILAGRVGLRAGGEEVVAAPGGVVTVEPGTPHRFWNAGDEEARFLCEVRPALGFESLIETMFALAAEGRVNRKGLPSPLRLAVIARTHFDTVRLPSAGPPPAGGPGAGRAPRAGAPLPRDRGRARGDGRAARVVSPQRALRARTPLG